MNRSLSISDNDICSTCKHCVYNPGELSFCRNDWPYKQFKNWNDEIQKCSSYEQITKEFENWSTEDLKELVS